jgi:hypothetical protein
MVERVDPKSGGYLSPGKTCHQRRALPEKQTGRGMRLRTLIIGLVAALAFVTAATARSSAVDPPRIVEWHMIGNIGLGMSRARVEYTYGNGVPSTRDFTLYRTGRGDIEVQYTRDRHVHYILTYSPAYRTKEGFGVGSHIPLGRCHYKKGQCVHLWHGFEYHPEFSAWLGNFGNTNAALSTYRGVVAWIGLYRPRLSRSS